MPWLILAVIVLILGGLGYLRLNIPREPDREGFNDVEAVRAYDRVSRWALFRWIRYLVLKELTGHHPRGVLIDIGCGPGYMTALIKQKLPALKVVGMDIEGDMVRLASRNWPGPVDFWQGDAQQLPLRNDSVDFVLSTLALHHWSNAPGALDEIYRVLKPGGQFLLFDLKRDSQRWVYYALRLGQRLLAPPAIRRTNGAVGSLWASYTQAELEPLLNEIPFRDWHIKPGPAWLFVWGYKL